MNTQDAVAIIESQSLELCKMLKSGSIKTQLSMPVVRKLIVREVGEGSTAYNKRTAEAYGVLKPVFNKFALQNATAEIEQYGVKSTPIISLKLAISCRLNIKLSPMNNNLKKPLINFILQPLYTGKYPNSTKLSLYFITLSCNLCSLC